MNTKLFLLLVALTGHAVLSRPDSYESYENLGLSTPYSSEESSAEIALDEEISIAYYPEKDGLPEEFYAKLRAKYGSAVTPNFLDTFKDQYKQHLKYLKDVEEVERFNRGEPLPEPTAAQKAKIDKKLNTAELKRINKLRALHGAPPLKYSEKLAAIAQTYVDKTNRQVKNGEIQEFDHNEVENKKYRMGENINSVSFSGGNAAFPAYEGESSDAWYFGEIDAYKHNGNQPYEGQDRNYQTGHFTQVVWQDTQQMGCGQGCFKKRNGLTECNVVCNFYPGGNVDGEFPQNVNMDYDEQTASELKEKITNKFTLLMFKQNLQNRGY